jgi:hypothetical protein
VFGHGLNRRHWLLALLVVQLLVLSALLRCPVGNLAPSRTSATL